MAVEYSVPLVTDVKCAKLLINVSNNCICCTSRGCTCSISVGDDYMPEHVHALTHALVLHSETLCLISMEHLDKGGVLIAIILDLYEGL